MLLRHVELYCLALTLCALSRIWLPLSSPLDCYSLIDDLQLLFFFYTWQDSYNISKVEKTVSLPIEKTHLSYPICTILGEYTKINFSSQWSGRKWHIRTVDLIRVSLSFKEANPRPTSLTKVVKPNPLVQNTEPEPKNSWGWNIKHFRHNSLNDHTNSDCPIEA